MLISSLRGDWIFWLAAYTLALSVLKGWPKVLTLISREMCRANRVSATENQRGRAVGGGE